MVMDTPWRNVIIAMAEDILSSRVKNVMVMAGIIALHVMAQAATSAPGVGEKAVKNVLTVMAVAERLALHVADGLVHLQLAHIVLAKDMLDVHLVMEQGVNGVTCVLAEDMTIAVRAMALDASGAMNAMAMAK